MTRARADLDNHPDRGKPLTVRELAVLNKLADGLEYAEIAAALYLTKRTVNANCESLRGKLGARNAANAVHIGHLSGIIGGDS